MTSSSTGVRTLISDADYAAVELFEGYPDGLLKFAFASCVIFMIIGIPGNIITIVALARYKRVHNATAFFIINLSCSDLLYCCLTTSFMASTLWNHSWTHGAALCRVYPFLKYVPMATSMFSILGITINRYIIIAYPTLYRKIYQKRNLIIMLSAIWIAPIILLIPTSLGKWGRFDLDQEHSSCTIIADESKISAKFFLLIVLFYLPYIPIILCYGRIFFIVRKATNKSHISTLAKIFPSTSADESTTYNSSATTTRVTAVKGDNNEEKGKDIPLKVITKMITSNVDSADETTNTEDEDVIPALNRTGTRRNVLKRTIARLKISLPTRKDKRLGTMILAIMISFCLLQLPVQVVRLLYWLTPYHTIDIIAIVLRQFSSCINPVVYVAMSSEYQKAYKNLFKRQKKILY